MPTPHTPSFQNVEKFGQTEKCSACRGFNDVSELAPLVDYACAHCGEHQRAMRRYRNFEIEGLLGYGGMSTVYRARDRNLQRVVALKLLLGEVTKDAQLRAALQKEAMMTASVNHANVVKIYDAGSEGETCYVAMELLEGGTLSDLIERGAAIPELRVLELGIQVAEGLNASWKRGLLHRDIKPGNVLFQDERTAKVSDFGLAVTVEEARRSQTPHWGTPVYISPERSAQQKEDVRSDIYSLGATLFHALAGRVPFEGQNLDEVEANRARGKAPSVQEFAPQVSNETAALLARTLEKKRDDRPQTYAGLIKALEHCRQRLQNSTGSSVSPSVSRSAEATSASRAAAEGPVKPQISRSSSSRLVWFTLAMIVLTTMAYGWKSGWLDNVPLTRNDASRFEILIAEARAAALRGDFLGSARSFLFISQDRNAPQSAKDWSNLQAGNSFLLANDLPKARAAFSRFDPRIDRSRDSTLEFLAQVARQCASMEPVPKAMAAGIRPDSHQAVGLLSYGLLDWDLGSYDDAAVFLRQFSICHPPGELWIDNYKPLMTPYLAELDKLAKLSEFDRTAPRDVRMKELQKLSDGMSDIRPNSPLLAVYRDKLSELGWHSPTDRAKPERKVEAPADSSKYLSTSPSTYGAPATIGFAFPSAVKINRWVVPAVRGDNGNAAVMFQLKASEDGVSWRQIDQAPYEASAPFDRKVAEFSARFVSLAVQEPGTAGDPRTRIAQCELYGAGGLVTKTPSMEANLALHKQAIGDEGSGPLDGPGAAFDGVPRSAWVHRGDPGWVGIDLAKPTKISRCVVMHAGSTDPGFPSRISAHNTVDFSLQASDDGEKWRDIDTVRGNHCDLTDRRVAVFTARYVRIYVTNSNDSGDPKARIGEFELYGPES